MATTPNYGWVTPAPTDYVTDLPADFETFADAADATVKALNPGTTAGDVDYYTSSTAKARLGIGTAGQVLTVNSGATAPEWTTPTAGGYTLLDSGSFSGASVTTSSLSGIYRDLFVVVRNHRPATDGAELNIRLNSDSNARYNTGLTSGNSGALTFNQTRIQIAQGQDSGTSDAIAIFTIPDYANTTTWKVVNPYLALSNDQTTTTSFRYLSYYGGCYNQTGAITTITFLYSTGNMSAGTYEVYGVK